VLRKDRRRAQYSEDLVRIERGVIGGCTDAHNICQRTVHISQEKVTELHRV
jgi:hypothetical protein